MFDPKDGDGRDKDDSGAETYTDDDCRAHGIGAGGIGL